MKRSIDRRDFLRWTGLASAAGLSLFSGRTLFAAAQPHVVVIGGGTGGATAAKYLKIADPGIRVTIVERNRTYLRCYGSNEVLNDDITMADLEVGYDMLRSRYGIEFVFGEVDNVDVEKRRVHVQGGETLDYDRLIVSPGIDFKYGEIENYTAEVAETTMPHAWKAGPQTMLLRKQLHAMPENGTFLIVPPANPYRCPPAPYERASLMAEWFEKHKPKAKVLILDVKDRFTKDQPFMLAWNRLYGFRIPESHMNGMPEDIARPEQEGRIEWVSGSNGGKVVSVDPKRGSVTNFFGDEFQADVTTVIPNQQAGKLAFRMGLTNDAGWCDNDRYTHESTVAPNVHVIGDSIVADDMPKSGFSANTQAKVAAAQIAHLLRGEEPEEPGWANTCFSRAGSEYGVSIADVYRYDHDSGRIRSTPGSGGVSPLDAKPMANRLEGLYQESWMRAFVKDCFY
ncbi:MAG: NAD(P)/FAD-dependent oxidoreductase [Halothiobacillaceae bacterium]